MNLYFLIGHYVYMEASGQLLGQSAALLSVPMTTDSVGVCMSWWYHMYGADIDRLNVYALRSGGSNDLEWVRMGNQGNDWMQGHVYVTGDFTVSFSMFVFFLVPTHVHVCHYLFSSWFTL